MTQTADLHGHHARQLLRLVEEWLPITHMWEEYIVAAERKAFEHDAAAEREVLESIRTLTEPLHQHTRQAGYSHADLLAILPHAHATTHQQREHDVQSLRELVHTTHPEPSHPPWESSPDS